MFGIRNSIPRGVAVIASSLGLAATALFTTQAQSADVHNANNSTEQAARGAMLAAQDVVDDLGAKAAGVYVSGDTMIVKVTKRSAFDDVRATGAAPQLVEHSTAALERVTTVIDKRTDIVGTSWGVDQTSNQVLVRADESVSGSSPGCAPSRIASATRSTSSGYPASSRPRSPVATPSGAAAVAAHWAST